MRLALETTQVRRRNRASQCRWREWSRSMPWVSSPDRGPGQALADEQPPLRNQLGVGGPVVGAVETRLPALHTFE